MRPDLSAAVSGPRRHSLRISALVEAESTQMTKPKMDDTTPDTIFGAAKSLPPADRAELLG